MSRRGGREDKRIVRAVTFKMRCQEASIPEAMRAAEFTLAESKDPAKQMAVHRACEKANPHQRNAPAQVSVAVPALRTPGTSVSPLTEPTREDNTSTLLTPSRDGDGVAHPKPKPRQTRLTATAMQKWRVNKFDASEHKKRAFKRAMSWYGRELEKGSDGLSSYEISKKVKREFDGVGPAPRTIQRYSQKGIVGHSPLKPGVLSTVPKWAYNSLCVAFESYVRINQLNRRDDVLTLKKLSAAINETLQHNYRSKMLNRVLLSTAKYLDASKLEYAEDRRIRWTTSISTRVD